MGPSDFNHILFLIRLYAFEICETFLFIALAVGLTVHTVRPDRRVRAQGEGMRTAGRLVCSSATAAFRHPICSREKCDEW
jgi:hypothetical protein